MCILVGILIAAFLTNRRLVARGVESGTVIDFTLCALVLGIIGARAFHVLTHPGDYFYDDTNLLQQDAYTLVDASLAYTNPTGVPDSTLWTSEFFYMPAQNTRLGIQFNMFTRYLGTASNYDGAGRNASDNNSTYIYLWTAI